MLVDDERLTPPVHVPGSPPTSCFHAPKGPLVRYLISTSRWRAISAALTISPASPWQGVFHPAQAVTRAGGHAARPGRPQMSKIYTTRSRCSRRASSCASSSPASSPTRARRASPRTPTTPTCSSSTRPSPARRKPRRCARPSRRASAGAMRRRSCSNASTRKSRRCANVRNRDGAPGLETSFVRRSALRTGTPRAAVELRQAVGCALSRTDGAQQVRRKAALRSQAVPLGSILLQTRRRERVLLQSWPLQRPTAASWSRAKQEGGAALRA